MADEPQIGPETGVPAPQAPPAAPEPTLPETITRDQYTRDMDRERDRYGKEKQQREALAARLAELEDASKTEAEKIAQKAAEFDALKPRVKALEKALAAQVEAIKGTLTEALRDLIPDTAPVEQQLAQAQKLLAAQETLAGQNPPPNLPAAGGRNPQPSGPGMDDKTNFEEAAQAFPTLNRLQLARRGP